MATATAPIIERRTSPATDAGAPTKRAWPKRRAWLRALGQAHHLTFSARVVGANLVQRSNDQGKRVWGNQGRMGELWGMSRSTVGRCLRELEAAGLLKVYRRPPIRGTDGRWSRRESNTYYLAIPPRELSGPPTGRRTPRASRCNVKKSRSHLDVTNEHQPASRGLQTPSRHHDPPRVDPETGEIDLPTPPDVAQERLGDLIASIRGGRPGRFG